MHYIAVPHKRPVYLPIASGVYAILIDTKGLLMFGIIHPRLDPFQFLVAQSTILFVVTFPTNVIWVVKCL